MDYSEKIDQYLNGPKLLRKSVAGMSPEQLRARPVAGKWSTLEVVCHIADFDPILADRMKRVIAEESPSLLSADENKFAGRLAYHERDLEEELRIIEMTRSQMGRILRKLRPEDYGRTGVHNVSGTKTLEQVLTSATNHIPHHVKFVEEKRRALGLPV